MKCFHFISRKPKLDDERINDFYYLCKELLGQLQHRDPRLCWSHHYDGWEWVTHSAIDCRIDCSLRFYMFIKKIQNWMLILFVMKTAFLFNRNKIVLCYLSYRCCVYVWMPRVNILKRCSTKSIQFIIPSDGIFRYN